MGSAMRSSVINQMGGRTTLQHWQDSDIKLRVQLIRKLGNGTYGTCYSGKYKGERFPVAIKIVLVRVALVSGSHHVSMHRFFRSFTIS